MAPRLRLCRDGCSGRSRCLPLSHAGVVCWRAAGSHIDPHDVRFVDGCTIDNTLPELRRQWFGRHGRLHLDAYMSVQKIDGWAVSLGASASDS